jgi:hypothetical protein
LYSQEEALLNEKYSIENHAHPDNERLVEKLSNSGKDDLIQKQKQLLGFVDIHMNIHLFPNAVEDIVNLHIKQE